MKYLKIVLTVFHLIITISLGTIVVLMVSADVSDFKTATFKKNIKQKQFEIDKMNNTIAIKDSLLNIFRNDKDSLDKSILSLELQIKNVRSDSVISEKKYAELNLKFKNLLEKEDEKNQKQERINLLNKTREKDILEIAKTFDKMKSKDLAKILTNHYDSETIVKIYRKMSVKKELIVAMEKHPERERFFSRVFGAKKPKDLAKN